MFVKVFYPLSQLGHTCGRIVRDLHPGTREENGICRNMCILFPFEVTGKA